MVFTKLLLENALAIRPCNCKAASEPLLPKVARCIPVLPSRYIGKCAARILKRSAEKEDFPAELGDGPDVVAETIKEIATLNIPSTQEFYALSPLNPGKKRKSSSKDASCPPKSREKEASTISKSKSNSSRPSCRSRLRIKSPENSSILKSSQPKTISVTSTRLLASSNSQSEVMGLKKTVESISASFVDFMQNSPSRVSLGLGLDQGLLAGNQGLGQTQFRDHSESLSQEQVLGPKCFGLLSC